eukprot:768382-Hanusia_phi.AAC.7
MQAADRGDAMGENMPLRRMKWLSKDEEERECWGRREGKLEPGSERSHDEDKYCLVSDVNSGF